MSPPGTMLTLEDLRAHAHEEAKDRPDDEIAVAVEADIESDIEGKANPWTDGQSKKIYAINLSVKDMEEFDAMCKRLGTTRSQRVRELIRAYIDSVEG